MTKSRDAVKAKDGHLFNTYLGQCIQKIRESAEVIPNEKSVEQIIQDEIVKNPGMNASTFFNLLKSLGITFNKANPVEPKQEADSTSTMSQNVRTVEKAVSLKGNLDFKTRSLTMVEAEKPKDGFVGFTKFGSILLKEGMGNFGDKYFYSKDALKSAVSVFEGKKAYADHPSQTDDMNRPERSVRDVFGYFTNLKYQESDGQGELYGELEILPDKPFDWARSLMTAAVKYSEKYPDKDFVGLSINASGDAKPVAIDQLIESATSEVVKSKLIKAKESGIDQLNVVNQIDDAVSCDLVTEAGAGGRIKELMEGVKSMDSKEKEMEKKETDQKEATVPPVQDGEASADGEHDDAAADIELIKKMIGKYMGDDKSEVSPEESAMVKEAYEACKEMGCKEDEAEEKAVHQLKLSKHMASKKEAMAKEAAEEKPADEKPSDEKPEDDSKKSSDESNKVKESNVSLKAENAALKQKLGQYDLQNQIDKICKESGLKTEVTKKFREAVVGAKSAMEIKSTWTTFKKAYDAINEEVVIHNFSESIAINGEKSFSTNTVDFADSLKN